MSEPSLPTKGGREGEENAFYLIKCLKVKISNTS